MTYGNTAERIPSYTAPEQVDEELEGWFEDEPFSLIRKHVSEDDEYASWYR